MRVIMNQFAYLTTYI